MNKVNYNEICKIYDSVREGDIITVNRIIEEGKIDSNSKILEIGCGTGNYTVLVSERTNAKVYGLDQSEGMLKKAKSKNCNINFMKGNAVYLDSFEEEKFDLVYMIDVIHHIKDINTMFKNIFRILKNNGSVFIFTDTHEHIRNRLTTKYFPETLEEELKRYQSTEEIISAMQQNSFMDIKSDTVILPDDKNYGQKLINIAEKKGYSMFNLISQDAIDTGIQRILEDIKHKKIVYHMRAPYIVGRKKFL
jgi:ubiquinone/menaquinone biosynthesis C-methylase UbiE